MQNCLKYGGGACSSTLASLSLAHLFTLAATRMIVGISEFRSVVKQPKFQSYLLTNVNEPLIIS
jgi:hypothetical protein